MSRIIVLGPSIDLPSASKAGWLRSTGRKLKIRNRDFLVAVDGGLAHFPILGKNFLPQIAIGDWDSVDRKTLRLFENGETLFLTLPRRKDASDLALALRVISSLTEGKDLDRHTELYLIGFTGGRPDHHLASLLEIANFAVAHGSKRRFQKVAAIGPEAEYHFLTARQSKLTIRKPAGTLISLFTNGGKAEGVSLKGFEYSLQNEKLEPGSRGLSNIVRAKAEISLSRGMLLAVIPTRKPASLKRRK